MATGGENKIGACFVCSETLTKDKDNLLVLSCCKESVHKTCMIDALHDKRSRKGQRGKSSLCPNCNRSYTVENAFVCSNEFTVAQTNTIENVFLLHHSKGDIPLTKKEIRGINNALKTPGVESMRRVSYRVFIVGVAFWLPLEREKYCEWEDVATRLSLGLIFANLSEMRSRFEYKKKHGPGKRRELFHQFLTELLEMSYESDDGRTRTTLVESCGDTACEDCVTFKKMFSLQSDITCPVTIPNREHFYQKVPHKVFQAFREVVRLNGKKNKK